MFVFFLLSDVFFLCLIFENDPSRAHVPTPNTSIPNAPVASNESRGQKLTKFNSKTVTRGRNKRMLDEEETDMPKKKRKKVNTVCFQLPLRA